MYPKILSDQLAKALFSSKQPQKLCHLMIVDRSFKICVWLVWKQFKKIKSINLTQKQIPTYLSLSYQGLYSYNIHLCMHNIWYSTHLSIVR